MEKNRRCLDRPAVLCYNHIINRIRQAADITQEEAMNTNLKHAAAAAAAGLMLIAAMPFTGSKADAAAPKIVVIGDGISAGKGLSDPSKSYAALTAAYYGADVTNLAVDGYTTDQVLTALDDPSVKAQLAKADVILFNAGMHDVMDPFMTEVADFKERLGLNFNTITDLYTLTREDLPISDEELISAGNDFSRALRKNRSTAAENITKIGDKLAAYPNAKVVCTNVYNPLSVIEQYAQLAEGSNRKKAYDVIKNAAEKSITGSINPAYQSLADTKGFTVLDVFTTFDMKAYQYTGLNAMAFEPNEEGHRLIANQVIGSLNSVLKKPETTSTTTTTSTTKATTTTTTAATTQTTAATTATTIATTTTPPAPKRALGDVDGDKAVNANDATAVLIAAAKNGTGSGTGLSPEEFEAADVDQNKLVNANDATAILRYAAAVGTGNQKDISAYT